MPIDFPSSPSIGQEYAVGATTWVYDGTKWAIKAVVAYSNDAAPVGTIVNFAGPAASIPPGWVACDGSAVPRSTYATLFASIGTTYGSGDGSTTFNLPDIDSTTGVFVIRWTTTLGVVATDSLYAAPVGSMMVWPRQTSYPTGWLRADGSAVSRTTYNDLYNLLTTNGTTFPYGSGDGSTTFNLPNMVQTGGPVYLIKATLSGGQEPSTIAHAASHVRGGADVADGDRLQVDYVPTGYTRDAAASGAGVATDLTAHLKGIDTGLAARLPLAGGTMTGAINSASTLSLATGGTNRLTIDSAGRVRMPNQPRFWARLTSSASASSTIVFDSVGLNIGSHYNNTNGRFTAPIAGDYCFSLSTIGWNTGTTRIAPRINGNLQGSTFHLRVINTSANYGDAAMSWIFSLNANDWVDCYIYESWAYGSGDWYTHWMGYLLS